MADASYQPAVYRKQGGEELIIASSGKMTVESGGSLVLDSGSSFTCATNVELSAGLAMASGSSCTFASGSGLNLASGSSFVCATDIEMTGALAMASGSSATFASGSGLNLASGSSFVCATDMEMSAAITMASGSSMTFASGSGVSLASGSSFSAATAMEIASGGSVALASGSALTIASGAYQTIPVQTLAKAQVATPVTNFGISALEATTTGPAYTMAAPTAAGQVKWITMYATSTGATHRLTLFSGSSGIPILTFVSPSSCNLVTMATSIGPYQFGMVSLSSTSWRIFSMNTVEPIAPTHKAT